MTQPVVSPFSCLSELAPTLSGAMLRPSSRRVSRQSGAPGAPRCTGTIGASARRAPSGRSFLLLLREGTLDELVNNRGA